MYVFLAIKLRDDNSTSSLFQYKSFIKTRTENTQKVQDALESSTLTKFCFKDYLQISGAFIGSWLINRRLRLG